MTGLPAVIYAAKSSPDEHDSVRSQIDRVEKRLRAEGGRVLYAPAFSEENVSGYKRSRGPELEAAISTAKVAAAEHGSAELWVFHSSRLARGSGRVNEARALGEVFYDLRRHGVALRSVEDDPYVTDEAFVGMASKMANKYSDDLAAHVRRGKRNQFERGQRLGGPVCDGYRLITEIDANGGSTRRYVLDEDRAPIFRRMAALAFDGLGDSAVARALNAEGHRTKAGRPWTRRRVQDTLTNPFYAGRTVIHRGTPQQEEGAGDWPALIDPDAFDRVQAMRAARDQAAKNHGARQGRRTVRYALAKLARCERCGARMYCVTSPYKRKDGSQQRSYVCANVRESTGLCDQPKIDATATDAAIIGHLNRLFIDFEGWLTELASGVAEQREQLEARLSTALDRLQRVEALESKLRKRYVEAVESDDANHRAVETTLGQVLQEKDEHQRDIRELQERLAEESEPPTDAMLDLYNDLSRAVRGEASDSIADLNERLRATFEEFRIDHVEDEVIGVLPILRADLIERYRDHPKVMADHEAAIEAPDLPEGTPAVLYASTAPPPVKALSVPTEMGRHTQL